MLLRKGPHPHQVLFHSSPLQRYIKLRQEHHKR